MRSDRAPIVLYLLDNHSVAHRRFSFSFSKWQFVTTVASMVVLVGAVLLWRYLEMADLIVVHQGLRKENVTLVTHLAEARSQVGILALRLSRSETLLRDLEQMAIDQDSVQLKARLDGPLPSATSNVLKGRAPSLSLEDPLDSRVLREVMSRALEVEHEMEKLVWMWQDHLTVFAALPTGAPADGAITAGFGTRRSPLDGRVLMHEGIDIANAIDTEIRAPSAGVIAFAGTRPAYGRTVIIDHGAGVETWFAHLKSWEVKEGQRVRRGDLIARMGNTGRSTSGVHLHYEVRVKGIPVDPLHYWLELPSNP